MPSQAKTILVTLGEELLLGLTPNSHLGYIGDQLRRSGARMHANITISDDPEDIAEHFAHYWKKADILITTGGLGPTVDDRTKELVAQTLGETLIFDPEIMSAIENRFSQLGLVLTDNNRKQAYRFSRAEVLANSNGTAPGLWLEKDGKILVMLPGPPNELMPIFEEQVLPRLRELGHLDQQENYLQIRTVGIGESALETALQPLFANYDGLEVAYCAHTGLVDCRIAFPRRRDAHDDLIALAIEMRALLGTDYLCCGNDSLPQVVSNIMRRRSLTLSTAESCTGGLLSHELTNLAGSSEFFCGGMVTYTNAAKEELLGVPSDMLQQHSPVSAETAIAMALGVSEKLETDYSLSATGYLGPGGGDEENPVGTVYIGLHSPRGTWARRHLLRGSRTLIKYKALNLALDWLRRELLASVVDQDRSHEELKAESDKIIRSLR